MPRQRHGETCCTVMSSINIHRSFDNNPLSQLTATHRWCNNPSFHRFNVFHLSFSIKAMASKLEPDYERLIGEPSELLLHNDIPKTLPSHAHSYKAFSRLPFAWSTSAVVTHLSLILLYTLVTLLVLMKGFHQDQQRLAAHNTEISDYCTLIEQVHRSSYAWTCS